MEYQLASGSQTGMRNTGESYTEERQAGESHTGVRNVCKSPAEMMHNWNNYAGVRHVVKTHSGVRNTGERHVGMRHAGESNAGVLLIHVEKEKYEERLSGESNSAKGQYEEMRNMRNIDNSSVGMGQVDYAGHFAVGHAGESHSGDCHVSDAGDGFYGVEFGSEITDGVMHDYKSHGEVRLKSDSYSGLIYPIESHYGVRNVSKKDTGMEMRALLE